MGQMSPTNVNYGVANCNVVENLNGKTSNATAANTDMKGGDSVGKNAPAAGGYQRRRYSKE